MGSFVGMILPGIFEIIGKYFKSDADKAEAQARITEHVLANEAAVINASRDVVKAEIESESVLARNWRPILMYFLMMMLVWITCVAPIFGLVDATIKSLQSVPDNLWNLLMIGMGGYLGGRTLEKIASNFGNKK